MFQEAFMERIDFKKPKGLISRIFNGFAFTGMNTCRCPACPQSLWILRSILYAKGLELCLNTDSDRK